MQHTRVLLARKSLLTELDGALNELTCGLVRLLHHSDDCSLVAEHLVFQTQLFLHSDVGLLLNLVEHCHFEERLSSWAFYLHEIGPDKGQVGGILNTILFRVEIEFDLVEGRRIQQDR